GRGPKRQEDTEGHQPALTVLQLIDHRTDLLYGHRWQQEVCLGAQPVEEIRQLQKAQQRQQKQNEGKYRKQRAVSQRGSIGGQIVLAEPLGRTLADCPRAGMTQLQSLHGIPPPTHSQMLTAQGPRSLGISSAITLLLAGPVSWTMLETVKGTVLLQEQT